jgi:CheY-like chemotaxis protein
VIPAAVLENCIDAANTIVLCAQHQKCIVDDILTISKLDSNLLLITPMVVQPVAVAQRAVKMFDAELQKKNIELKFVLHDSITELKVDWAVLDPSRLLQVLINLITNAIKFTQGQSKRLVTVRFAASLEAPVSDAQGFEYIPTKSGRTSLSTTSEHWGSGEVLYLQFEVQDTGRGLTVDEKQLLFQRFSQASPRTHAQYGGSGLGLFISRQLTELHGGQIGVMSEAGVGSTFAFYIRAKRSLSSDHEGHLSMEAAIGKSEWQGQSYVSQMVQSGDPYLNTPLSHSHRGMSGSPSMKAGGNYHVLVVEDNLVNQRVMCKQLEKAGCTVNVASHGEEALSYLATTRFFRSSSSLLDGADGAASPASPSSENPGGASRVGGHDLSVILMDLEMPVMDGLTCVKRIREWEAEGVLSGRIPVIAVTANVRTEQIRAAREAGMDDVVSKPFRIPQLLAKIGGLLAKPKPMGEGKGEGKGEGRENEVVVGA